MNQADLLSTRTSPGAASSSTTVENNRARTTDSLMLSEFFRVICIAIENCALEARVWAAQRPFMVAHAHRDLGHVVPPSKLLNSVYQPPVRMPG